MLAKRRQKSSKACSFCRRRKIKCDMGQPCSSCMKYGCLDCNYDSLKTMRMTEEEATENRREKVEFEISMLEKRISELRSSVSDDNETISCSNCSMTPDVSLGMTIHRQLILKLPENDVINFYDGYFSNEMEQSRISGKGPLSWFSLMKIDLYLSTAWLRLVETEDLKHIILEGKNTSKLKGKQIMQLFPIDSHTNYKGQLISSFSSEDSHDCSQSDRSWTGASDCEVDMELINKIQSVIPKMGVIKLLVDRFFSHINGMCSVFIEASFRERIKSLLGQVCNDDTIPKIMVRTRRDLVYMGSLLVALRFSYLSLFTCTGEIHAYETSDSERRQQLIYMIGQPITLDLIEVARSCLDQFDLSKEIDLAIFQFVLLTRIYEQHAPEVSDVIDKGKSQINLSTLFELAFSLGLERDPRNTDIFSHESEVELRRKLWFLLLILDVNGTMSNGSPLNCSKFSFDTHLPNLSDFNVKHGNSSRRASRLDSYSHFEYLFSLIRLITDVRGVKASQITEEISSRERAFPNYDRIRELIYSSPLVGEPLFKNTVIVEIYLRGSAFLLTIFFHFFIHFERKRNESFCSFYFKRVVIKIRGFLEAVHDLVENNHIIFEHSSDLLAIPSIQLLIHKCLICLSAIIIRINLMIRRNSHNHRKNLVDTKYNLQYEKNLETFSKLLQDCYQSFLGIAQKVGHKNYYSSVIDTIQQGVLDTINSQDFCKPLTWGTTFINIPNEQLTELCQEFAKTLETVETTNSTKVANNSSVEETGVLDEFTDPNNFTGNTGMNEFSNMDYEDTYAKQLDPLFSDFTTLAGDVLEPSIFPLSLAVSEFNDL
ncbi:uncharacterized protein PRCAT00006163001 [Priceomyces carsonii]|uniref:uncharacterized protein n=1 Tax=Priceomyces carsonii TaxID=28549 RepID=UPI002EDB3AE9|nr:unnamed protein product [Priceomyces carsonii]